QSRRRTKIESQVSHARNARRSETIRGSAGEAGLRLRDYKRDADQGRVAGRRGSARPVSSRRAGAGATASPELQARLARRHFPQSNGERSWRFMNKLINATPAG